ncbi:MAG: response regulator transcription factor [Bacteroidia bacterium]|nr:response regulator transcription factor [Bacteroidia bacterium]
MRVAIIEDEIDSRKIIKSFLNDMPVDVTVVGEAGRVSEAIELLSHTDVDAVLLDVQLPNGTGFDILEGLDAVDFKVIFITAYDSYAIQAIKHSALDYLLKPLNRKDFGLAMSKVSKKAEVKVNMDRVQELFKQLGRDNMEKIRLPTLHGFKWVRSGNVVRCEADKSYTYFFLTDESKVVVSKTMKKFEPILLEHGFIRVHHSYMVNPAHIVEYKRGRGGDLIMSDGSRVSVSESRRTELLDRLT